MYVRWKARPRRAPLTPYWSAELVVSERVDIDGVRRPRQRIVAYLGAIPSDKVHIVNFRWLFWRGVIPRLDAIALAPELRARLEDQLAARVPMPTAEDIAADRAEWHAQLARLHA